MNNKNILKRRIAAALYFISAILFIFSAFIIFIVHNVKAMKMLADDAKELTYEEFVEKLRKSNPDLYNLGMVEISLPDNEKIPLPANGTIETGLKYFREKIEKIKKELTVKLDQKKPPASGDEIDQIKSSIAFYKRAIDVHLIDYACRGLKNVERDYLEAVWKLNKSFRDEMVSTYYRPIIFAAATEEGILDFDAYWKKYNSKFFNDPYLKFSVSNLLEMIAFENGDIEFAMMADYYKLRETAAAAFLFCPKVPKTRSLNDWEFIASEYSDVTKALYLKDDRLFSSEKTRKAAKEALLKRVEFLRFKPDFTMTFNNEFEAIKKRDLMMATKDKLTYGILNIWYGDPNQPFYDAAAKINEKPGNSLNEIEKILIEYVKKIQYGKSYTIELANSGDGLISMFKFVKFAINMHPFATKAHFIPVSDLKNIACNETFQRIVTLGGLARLFYFENGRWPDLSKDTAFVNEAGIAAVDPYDNANIRSEIMADGSVRYFGSVCKVPAEKHYIREIFEKADLIVPKPANIKK